MIIALLSLRQKNKYDGPSKSFHTFIIFYFILFLYFNYYIYLLFELWRHFEEPMHETLQHFKHTATKVYLSILIIKIKNNNLDFVCKINTRFKTIRLPLIGFN